MDGIKYIQRDNPAAALNFFEKAEETLKRLEDFPKSGRPIPEFPSLSFREIIVPPYRFFYRIVDDTIWIVATCHSSRLPGQPDSPGA